MLNTYPMEPNVHNTLLRKGWTTGACATAASKAAFAALVTGAFLDPVEIVLPGGQNPAFTLAKTELGNGWAMAAIVKDAGDDPDVTHGALVCATVRWGAAGSGVTFQAGDGVGTVTKPGLALAVGEPAINPMPRQMMQAVIAELATQYGKPADVQIEISVPGGQQIARKTMNPRLGIMEGISILGTTGIVIPFSCSAWIHSIHRGIDVARAEGISHVAGATGSTSEAAVQKLYGLQETALIDMGDFVGGMLKYIRKHPVQRVTIAGGFAKMTKLAQGLLDLHSRAGEVDLNFLADMAGIDELRRANTAKHALELAGKKAPQLAQSVADKARDTAVKLLEGTEVALDVAVFDREGNLLARTA